MRLIFSIITFSIISCSYGQTEQSFDEFAKKLKQISLDEDLNALKTVLYDTIFESNDICGYPGCSKDEFLKFYFTEDTINDDWRLLRQIISSGFIKIDNDSAIVHFDKVSQVYEAPTYWRNVDINKELQILEKNTEIKERPDINSKTLIITGSGKYHCNCCIYNQTNDDVIENANGNVWIKIELKNQKQGYVQAKKTSQRWMRILEIGKVNGRWVIIAFYRGEPC